MVSGHKKGSPYIAKVADKRMGSKISLCTGVPLVIVIPNLGFVPNTFSPVQNNLTTTSSLEASTDGRVPGTD